MRLSLLCASAALVAGLVLSGCSGSSGSAPAASSAAAQAVVSSHGHQMTVRPMPGVKILSGLECGSQYSFCFYVVPGNAGPYVETSSSVPLYNVGSILKNKKEKVDKKFDDYFYPDPGDPTYQYILYSGKTPKKPGKVKFTDVYCIGFTPSDCGNGTGSILYLGIALSP
jgi:hypothetical protein